MTLAHTHSVPRRTPRLKEAREFTDRWRSCRTDRDRHEFIKALRKTWPEMADRFAKLVEQ